MLSASASPIPAIWSRSLIVPVLLLGLCGLPLGGCDRQTSPSGQAGAAAGGASDAGAPAAASPPAKPGAVDRSHAGEAPPSLTFLAPDGKPTTLAAFKGRKVLVNLWATWCGPCVKELPTLDALAARFPVVAVAEDTDRAAVTTYLAKARLARLKPYVDPKTALSIAYNASLPTTILLDANGREVWRTSGGRDWSGAGAAGLLGEGRR